jgi:dihydroxy-acid dehydratase
VLTRSLARALQVGISACWYEGNSCNMHLMDLAAAVKEGVQDAGLVRSVPVEAAHASRR